MRVFCACFLIACTAGDPPLPTDAPSPPAKDDSPFQITGARAWYLIGDAVTPGTDELKLSIAAPDGTAVIDYWLDRHYQGRTKASSHFAVTLDLTDVAAGEHELLFAADGASTAFGAVDFHRSYPLYVAVSNDWDTGDHTDDKLERQDRLHANHPQMVITHFMGPYTFTDPTVTAARAQLLVDWVKNYRDTKGDEIGLHIHPYCNFVTTAGVTCRTSPSFAHTTDATGYTVELASYTEPELEKMFAKASQLFVAHGLDAPTSFRAGGWTASGDVLKAMATAGHVTDASGCNWARLEEWKGVPDASLYEWNMAHWAPIDETSQPYYPSEDDILADAAPHVSVLEVPDNGALVDYVTAAEMIQMFRSNFDGRALLAPKHYSIGYHPVDFSESFFDRIDGALTEIDKHLAADDGGPVVYARMSDLPKVFKPAQ